ncbi:glutamate-5-semialdehyde dehydrogenase [Aerococcus kribbianus]|uniref:Gamma-glutamyl phosphate reductase n=1 Tax=Aerococcus kribbianus TaxID=2999064 RepID=A0A9X3JD98_9LACT|nr:MULTISPECIES: glutamate-5-semialdehyde dehydrogenase [unclassified Aerococcus]MCZ0717275.1 glutamate-5-semialdehyde dehydrogenase [Aerococcus sp. YH-aer221]MCZ0725563.1 glutamate-5-semialdehyde dehydrogenase [Aerococcus sp. YH-aer222]
MINEETLYDLGTAAKKAAKELAQLPSQAKNRALNTMAQALRTKLADILAANQKDIAKTHDSGRPESFIERMTLTEERVESMAAGLEKVAQLADPIGSSHKSWINEDGLEISQRTVPLGVIGIIYESRPNVTADAVGLCFKSGNAVILRGGKETINSNLAILNVLKSALRKSGITEDAVAYIDNPDRQLAQKFMQMNDYVDCLIPRGSQGLIQNVVKQATIPTIETGVGNDHLYVHKDADLDKALAILINGKTQRVSVCNALETLLVDQAIAKDFLPRVAEQLADYNVLVHADQAALTYFPDGQLAKPQDYAQEFLDYEIAIKVVADYDEAINHIDQYSTQHTEVIVTENYSVAQDFINAIDAAVVNVNASSRFSDGEKFGFGGEIGISTQKLHARGPMGLDALTSYKYVVLGSGQIRQ